MELSDSKCIPEKFYIRFAALKINAHNIKTNRWISFGLAQKFARHVEEIAPFFGINRGFSGHNVARGTGLYFNKA